MRIRQRQQLRRTSNDLCTERNLRLKIDWASHILFLKFTVFLCFTLYLRTISKYKPPGAYIWRDDLTEGFLRYEFWGLIFGGTYFRNSTVGRFGILLGIRKKFIFANIEGSIGQTPKT